MRAPAILATADEAIAAIPSGSTIAVSGFVGAGHAELLTSALERRFLQTGTPTGLTLYYCAGQGDRAERGLNHLAHRGLLKRIIGGHWNLAPKLGTLALANEVEAYNLPQGVLSVLTREIAAKRPGLITQVGLNTFIDPIHSGGKLNARTTEPLVERLELDGQTWLRYKPAPIHVALIRATYADARGNLSMEGEGLIGEVLSLAQAAKNHGGIVIAQVESVVDQICDPKSVRVPGALVDYIVTSAGVMHEQTFGEVFNESYVVSGGVENIPVMEESDRKRIGARALAEIRPGDIVNLGISQAPEGRRIFSRMSVLENLQMGAVPSKGRWFDEDVEKVFTLFPRLKERLHQRGGTLSGGEQQMLAIGRALLARPKMLLLDEPSLGIAPILVQQIFKAIVEINRTQGLTILLVEQNAYQALKIAHRGYVLATGRMVMSGTGQELLANPEIRTAYLEGGH